MIRFNFEIDNCFKHLMYGSIKHLFYKDIRIATHKHLEIELTKEAKDEIFSITFDTTWNGYDHAGPKFELIILGIGLYASINDNRHWDDSRNDWVKY